MDELFTESAKAVLAIAQEEAKYFRHQSVGSEHLLLALVLEPNGIAGKTLRQLNTDTEDIREEIEHLSGYGTMQSQWGITTYTCLIHQEPNKSLPISGDEAETLRGSKDWYRAFIIRLVKRRRNFSV